MEHSIARPACGAIARALLLVATTSLMPPSLQAQPVETGPRIIGGSLLVQGPVTVHGALTVAGNILVQGPLTAQWLERPLEDIPPLRMRRRQKIFHGPLTVHGSLVVRGDLEVRGPLVVDGPVSAVGNIDANGPIQERDYAY